MAATRIHFAASDAADAQAALAALSARYGQVGPAEADAVVALGGDGFMLQTLHAGMGRGVPVYGMNRGTVGFLMNAFAEDGLPERLATAERAEINPLRMRAEAGDGEVVEALAVNEVALLRQTRQTARIAIRVDGRLRMAELTCDGVLVATPAGSTAYNLSAHGPIIPIGAPLMALTPISAFRPRRWRGALLPKGARVGLEVLEPDKRPVSATADYTEVRQVRRVEVAFDETITLSLLFDPGHGLEERLVREQFAP